MKNKSGFTLIELLVTIALVCAVFTAASFGLKKVLQNTRDEQYMNYIYEVLDSSKTYIAMKKLTENCDEYNECCTLSSRGISNGYSTIKLGCVVNSGLLSKDIYNISYIRIDLQDSKCSKFSENTDISFKLVDGETKVIFGTVKCNSDNYKNCDNFFGDCE